MQAGQRQEISCFLSAFVSFYFPPHFYPLFNSLPKNEDDTSSNQNPRIKQLVNPPVSLFLSFFSPKTSALSLRMLFLAKRFKVPSFFFSRPTLKSRMICFTNTGHWQQFLKPQLNLSDKLHSHAVEKTKLQREAWLAMINSKRLFTTPLTSSHNNKKISETSRKVFALALKFAGLLPEKISKIFQNRSQPLKLYKLRHFEIRDDTYPDLIAIKDCILRIWNVTRLY